MNVRKSLTAALALLVLGWSAAHAEQYTVPLFLAPGTSGDPQGVLRLVNDTGEAATVRVFAIADDGTRAGPATIALGASAAVQFDATELRSANAAKGLSGGLGSFPGDVRLSIDSDAPIVPLAFARASDGTLSAMHDTVRPALAGGEPHRYEIPVFNPSTEAAQASRLRLINPGDTSAAVTIGGRDDSGAPASGGDVTLMLPAGGAQTLTARQLEAGGAGLTGRLGATAGGWRLTVSSDLPLQVVNVVASSTGHWNNLSTTAVRGAAPADPAGFDDRFVGQSAILETGGGRSSFAFMANGRFSETARADGMAATSEGGYDYVGLGPDAGQLTLDYDDGRRCRASLYFSSGTGGWYASRCTGGLDAEETWRGGNWFVEGEEDDGGGGDPVQTTYGVNDALPGVPTSGLFVPARLSGASVRASGGSTTIDLDDGGHIDLNDGTRYTCASAGGCAIVDGTVTRGSVQSGLTESTGDMETPPSPTNVRYVRDGSTIVLSWDAVQGADYYRIYYDDFAPSSCQINSSGRPSFCDELASRVTGTGYTHDSPDDDRNYYWVVACNSGGCSDIDSANPADFVDTRPGPPTNIRYVRDGSTIVVSWDAVQGADYYKIYYDDFVSSACRLDSSGRPSFCDELASRVTGTGYTHDSPDDDRNYYWVVACNSGGCSDIDSANPADFVDTRPGSPTNVRYVRDGSTTVVSWDAVQGADYYKIYYDDFVSSACRLDSSGRPSFCDELASRVTGAGYTHDSPDDDRNYYWVVACNSGGCSDIDSANPAVDGGGTGGDGTNGGTAAPDLTVGSPSVSNSNPAAGASFTLRATVRNDGDASSAVTTLRYYRSTNATISRSDTQVGTDGVSGLSASRTSAESISLTAPSSAGTYYYGACVDSVAGESDADNNCSSGVRVAVVDDPSGGSGDAVPSSPRNIRVNREGSNVRVTWNSSSGATHYEVWRCDTRLGPLDCEDGLFFVRSNWTILARNVTATSYVDRSPPTSAPFSPPFNIVYTVQACNSSGCSGIL